jgi:hypothetical protein
MWAMYEAEDKPGFTYQIFEEADQSSYKWARTFVKGYAAICGAERILSDCDELYPCRRSCPMNIWIMMQEKGIYRSANECKMPGHSMKLLFPSLTNT